MTIGLRAYPLGAICYIMAGVPGAGKSHLLRMLGVPSGRIASADTYFLDSEGVYRFDPTRLPQAHDACMLAHLTSLQAAQAGDVFAVDNTGLHWEHLTPYVTTCQALGVAPVVVHLAGRVTYGGGRMYYDHSHWKRQTHGVPRGRWEVMSDRSQALKHEKAYAPMVTLVDDLQPHEVPQFKTVCRELALVRQEGQSTFGDFWSRSLKPYENVR
jgi:hypothetical protein